MTTRERWIVYPLLFLALGFGFKSGLILEDMRRSQSPEPIRQISADIIQSSNVRCRQLQVVDANNQPRVVVGTNGRGGSGAIEIYSEGRWKALRGD